MFLWMKGVSFFTVFSLASEWWRVDIQRNVDLFFPSVIFIFIQQSSYYRHQSVIKFVLWSCKILIIWWHFFFLSRPIKLQKKQCGGVYFLLYGIAFWMQFEEKLSPIEWPFNVFGRLPVHRSMTVCIPWLDCLIL